MKERDMTQSELAAITGLTQSAISHYLKGDRTPRGPNLFRIADALGVPVDELVSLMNGYSPDIELTGLKHRLSMIADDLSLDQKMELIKCLFEGENYIK